MSKCRYCAFNSIVAKNEIIENYIKALCKEIETQSPNDSKFSFASDSLVETIYFGGGTPSILSIAQFSKIFDALEASFNLNRCKEITIEANPGTLSTQKLKLLSSFRIANCAFRISLGVQSFNDNLLKILGRIHTSQQAIEAVESAKKIFNNVSIDLMYELPNQTLKDVDESLKIANNLEVNHISIYGLEIEPETEFDRLNKINELNLPTSEEGDKMYDLITSELPKFGFNRYEISNFAKIGFESQHNLGYWSDIPYLGFGAGAHSYNKFLRWSNVSNVDNYINAINNDVEFRQVEEVVTKKTAMEEFCFLGLRKTEGINIKTFKEKFKIEIETIFKDEIKKLIDKNLLKSEKDFLRLTPLGMKYGNLVFAEFLL